ncbi:GDSL-type esterase/lipase family protein [Hyalangium versicolor]|uniref:GDSL-type esterase/lipase family protein n=1 Tax=Hyalangium versicolor TaxID=2861190 RepID=UPI001CCEB85A|nr:GDSL-type esterase/lipase family protein [Hyalangium versicolor]
MAASCVACIALVSLRSSSAPDPTPRPTAPAVASAEPADRESVRIAAARAIARTLAPLPSRRLPEPTHRDQELFKLAAALKAPGAAVENPCTEWAGPFCARTTLDPFFSALDGLRSGNSASKVTLSAFGNSLIASDRIVDIVRDDLSRMFGSGGQGLLLIDRIADYGGRVRTGNSASGWIVRTVGDIQPSSWPLGMAGVVHVSDTPRARARFALSGEKQGTLFWVDKDAGPIELRVDGKLLLETSPKNEGHSQQTAFTLPEGSTSLEIIAHKKGTAVHGIVLDRPTPGIVLDTLGVPAADASLFLHAEEEMVADQLRSRDPTLVLIMLGGNEVKRLQWGRSTFEKVERDLHLFIQRIKRAAPASACLMVGPLDAVLGPGAARPFQQRAELLEVIELERKISLEEGCAFFDMFAAMGGAGSLQRFQTRGLVHEDLVHPRGQGLDLLGALLGNALLKSWSETPRAEQPYALAEAWATLVGSDLLPHEVQPWRQAPPVALLPGDPRDPVTRGFQRVLAATRAWTPRSEEARWLVLDPSAAHALPRSIAKAGPVSLRCASLVSTRDAAPGEETCLPVTLPPLPPDLQDPIDRGVTVGAWLLAELVRHDSLVAAGRAH